MENLVLAIRRAVESANWYGAIYLALTMPDICSKLQFPNASGSGARYKAWFDRYLKPAYTVLIGGKETVFLAAGDCYGLRCSILHEGSEEISEQRVRESLNRFYFTTMGAHRVRANDTLTLNVRDFCEEMCAAVGAWEADVGSSKEIQTRIAEMVKVRDDAFTPIHGLQIGGVGPADNER
jgi:hypothetical protein